MLANKRTVMTVTLRKRDGPRRLCEGGETWDMLVLDVLRLTLVPSLAGDPAGAASSGCVIVSPPDQDSSSMAVLSHEGTYPIMYGPVPLPVGAAHRTGYLSRPDEAGEFPVVVVLPGLDGLGSFEKDLCRRFARSGLAAIAIDLYRSDTEPLGAYNELTDARALTDLDEVREYVASEDVPWNAGERIGLLGVDVGGRFALLKASRGGWVGSVAVCYTPLTGDEDRDLQVAEHLAALPVPVLGLFGSADDLIDPASVDEAQDRNQHGQWLLYDGAGHGFLDPEAAGFDEAAADDAIARLIAFFGATLPQASVEELG
jgi:carboxymethylenebutenolidase